MSFATLSVPSLSGFLSETFSSFARNRCIRALQIGVKIGSLEIVEQNGSITFGNPRPSSLTARINVLSDAFWVRVYLSCDVGFSESYMAGEFSTPDLTAVFNLWMDNRDTLGELSSIFHKLTCLFQIISTRFFNHSISKAIDNAAGYDASNELYQAFLSREMQYSVPIWSEEEGGVRGDLEGRAFPGDLEQAQARKLSYILAKARVRPGDRILEVGTGWGGLALAAARLGCSVDTLTLSVEQKALVDKHIKEAGFENQIRVHLMDYRHMPSEFKEQFDAFISLEMLEVVGRKYMPVYLRMIDWALKPDRAAAVLTGASFPEVIHTDWQGIDFVRKYHWPNGVSPSATSLIIDAQVAWNGKMSLESLDDLGYNYPRCLREWERRLEKNWNADLVANLVNRYPELEDQKKLEIFKRKWVYMFKYYSVGYARGYVSSHCWTYVRPWNPKAKCD